MTRSPLVGTMWSNHLLLLLTSCILAINVYGATAAAWPNGPFVTSGRWITDADRVNVTYAGVNWPAAADIMIPEGLQYQSIEAIVSKIKSANLNSIRLTYAIEMIDQVYDNGNRDIAVRDAFVKVLGDEDGEAVFDKIVKNNPNITSETTRLEVRAISHGRFPARSPDLAATQGTNLISESSRSSMLWQQSAGNKKSMSTWIITCPKLAGAASPLTVTPGGVTSTSQSITGCVALPSWPITLVDTAYIPLTDASSER